MNRSRSSRRDFLKRATAFSAAIAAPYFWSSSTLRAESKNDRLNVAAIGTSIYTDRWGHKGEMDGRGAVVGHQAGKLGNMVAVADVNRRYAERFASRYDGRCRVYGDYRKLLDRNDVEAVTIGTPDHWHTNIAMQLKRKVRWDPEKEDFIGDDEARARLSREQREPYTINV